MELDSKGDVSSKCYLDNLFLREITVLRRSQSDEPSLLPTAGMHRLGRIFLAPPLRTD